MKYFVFAFTVRRNSKRHSGISYHLASDPRDAERRLRHWLHDRYPGHRIVVTLTSTMPA